MENSSRRVPFETRNPHGPTLKYTLNWLRFCAAVAAGDSDNIDVVVSNGKGVEL